MLIIEGKPIVLLTVLLVAMAAVGCGGAAPPNERLASAEGALQAAQEAGARNTPQASLYLKLAERQIAKGKLLMQDGSNDRARLLLLRAESDAELARFLAREQAVVAESQAAVKESEQLKAELERLRK
jgi:hypothetical protein